MRSRNSTLATPETRKMPLPTLMIVTWIGSQNDRRAGTTGAASAYNTVAARNMRINTGTTRYTHMIR